MEMGRKDGAKWVLVAAALLFQGTAYATDPLVTQAKQLIEAGQADRA